MPKLTKRKPGESLPSNNIKASPAEVYVRALKGEYYLLGEVAEIVGVAKNTLRRLIKTDNVKAPSHTANLGKMSFYVFNKKDVEEIRNYYQGKYSDFKKTQKLPPGRPRGQKNA